MAQPLLRSAARPSARAGVAVSALALACAALLAALGGGGGGGGGATGLLQGFRT